MKTAEKINRIYEIRKKTGLWKINLLIGKEIYNMKRVIPHGQFLPWIKENLNMPLRTAQLYMKQYMDQHLGENNIKLKKPRSNAEADYR